jgi:hypothetical protein
MATDKKTFATELLAEDEFPSFLGHAALRAARGWKEKKTDARLVGSPGFKPSAAQARMISKMAVAGLKTAEISRILNIEKSLLEFYYKYELDSSKLRANAAVGMVALRMALDKLHPEMTRFWLKTQAGWKETEVHEHTGIDAAADEARIAREKLLGEEEPSRSV